MRAEFDDSLFDQDDLYANSSTRKRIGTGLGLRIARQVICAERRRLAAARLPGGSREVA